MKLENMLSNAMNSKRRIVLSVLKSLDKYTPKTRTTKMSEHYYNNPWTDEITDLDFIDYMEDHNLDNVSVYDIVVIYKEFSKQGFKLIESYTYSDDQSESTRSENLPNILGFWTDPKRNIDIHLTVSTIDTVLYITYDSK